jgi:hypothetical protein
MEDYPVVSKSSSLAIHLQCGYPFKRNGCSHYRFTIFTFVNISSEIIYFKSITLKYGDQQLLVPFNKLDKNEIREMPTDCQWRRDYIHEINITW